MRIGGIIAAAGRSERMGRPKALVELFGKTLAQHLVDSFVEAGIEPVLVTTPEGSAGDAVSTFFDDSDVRCLPNPHPQQGLAGSWSAALTEPDIDLWVLAPVDAPFAPAHVILDLLDAIVEHPNADAIVPVVDDTAAHPVVVARRVLQRLASACGEGGLRAILTDGSSAVVRRSFNDRRLLLNLNRPSDLRAISEPW